MNNTFTITKESLLKKCLFKLIRVTITIITIIAFALFRGIKDESTQDNLRIIIIFFGVFFIAYVIYVFATFKNLIVEVKVSEDTLSTTTIRLVEKEYKLSDYKIEKLKYVQAINLIDGKNVLHLKLPGFSRTDFDNIVKELTKNSPS